MLSGIKTGKRKRPAPPPSPPPPGGGARIDAVVVAPSGNGDGGGNRDVGGATTDGGIPGLQRRGRISDAIVVARGSRDDDAVVVDARGSHGAGAGGGAGGVRYDSRGKLSRRAHDRSRREADRGMTVGEMAARERDGDGTDMDVAFARNVLRMGGGFNKLERAMGTNSRSGADEEDYLQETSAASDLYRSNDDKLSPAELASRSASRQVARHDALSRWTARSWWWMESPSFERRYLIALGERVSLVMTPSHRRLQQQRRGPRGHPSGEGGTSYWEGGQCHIVPLSYCESFVGLDEDAWDEVRRFQSSLRRMFRADGRGVVFLETVARTSSRSASGGGAGAAATQARMDVVPVPRDVERDAPLYFRSALAEVAQEWGTHGHRPIALDGRKRTLRNAIPSRGFPYFYCGWGNEEGDDDGGGYVQPIENEDDGDDDGGGGGGNAGGSVGASASGGMRGGGGSKRFPRDFGMDVIGGMMGCDPMQFQRKTPARDGDRGEILRFCDMWKEFDWTLELDG